MRSLTKSLKVSKLQGIISGSVSAIVTIGVNFTVITSLAVPLAIIKALQFAKSAVSSKIGKAEGIVMYMLKAMSCLAI